MTVRGGVAPEERPVYSSSSPDQPQAPAGRHGSGFHPTGVGPGPCRSSGFLGGCIAINRSIRWSCQANPRRLADASKPPNGKRMDQAGVERATGPSCRATSPAERSGAECGKRCSLANRAPHPFPPAVVRATFYFAVIPPKRLPAEPVARHNPLHPSPIELALRSLRSFVASKTLCLSLPSPPKASAIRATHCAPEPYSLVRENSCNPCQPMLAANAFLKINARKVADPLAANNPVCPDPATLLPDAGLPTSSPGRACPAARAISASPRAPARTLPRAQGVLSRWKERATRPPEWPGARCLPTRRGQKTRLPVPSGR
jgi:hypothetical protein